MIIIRCSRPVHGPTASHARVSILWINRKRYCTRRDAECRKSVSFVCRAIQVLSIVCLRTFIIVHERVVAVRHVGNHRRRRSGEKENTRLMSCNNILRELHVFHEGTRAQTLRPGRNPNVIFSYLNRFFFFFRWPLATNTAAGI